MIVLISAQRPCLREIVDRISRKFHPVQIILFGSWVHVDAREDCDVVFLVVLSKVEHKRKAAIQIGNSLNNLPISKDFIVTTSEEIKEYGKTVGNILLPALQEGKLIYENK